MPNTKQVKWRKAVLLVYTQYKVLDFYEGCISIVFLWFVSLRYSYNISGFFYKDWYFIQKRILKFFTLNFLRVIIMSINSLTIG